MAIPTAYTETQLQEFMLLALKDLGPVLELCETSFDDAVIDTLLAYGVDDVAAATDIKKLRALAKVEAWKVAVVAAGARIDWQESGASFKQSQYRPAAQAGLALALADASRYIPVEEPTLPGYEITVGQMSQYDPYA